jgi:uncharacterized tellurite resistance protein B-like protein
LRDIDGALGARHSEAAIRVYQSPGELLAVGLTVLIQPEDLVIALSGALMAVLGVGLVFLNPRHKPTLAFAALMLARAGSLVMGSLESGAESANQLSDASVWGTFSTVFNDLGIYAAVMWFLLEYPRGRFGPRGTKIARFALLGATIVALAIWASNTDLIVGYAIRDGKLISTLGPWPRFTFAVVGSLWPVVALVLVRDLSRSEPGPAHRSLTLVTLGFVLLAAHDGIRVPFGTLLAGLGMSSTFAAVEVRDWITMGVDLAALIGVLWYARRTSEARLLAGGAALTATSSCIAVLVMALGGGTTFLQIENGFVRLALPLLVGYALARYQIFDIDLKVRWTIKNSTIAAVFIGVFVVVEQLAQNFVSQTFGVAAGALAAGLLLVAIHPIQHAAERVSVAAVPNARVSSQLTGDERLAIYLAQAKAAWADGVMEKSERVMLDRLRDTLGLTHEEAARLESEVTAS